VCAYNDDPENYCAPAQKEGTTAGVTKCGDVPGDDEPCKVQGTCTDEFVCSGPVNGNNGYECQPANYCAKQNALYCTDGSCQLASLATDDSVATAADCARRKCQTLLLFTFNTAYTS
jgi:hypothetical protein